MYRNSPTGPFLALLLALALFSVTLLSRARMALRTGIEPAALSTVQIWMMAFAVVLLVYAIIGFISIWLEGEECRPGRHVPGRGRWPLVAGLSFAALLVASAGLFARAIVHGVQVGEPAPVVEACLAAGIAAGAVGALLVYQRYFMTREVIAEDEDTEVPW